MDQFRDFDDAIALLVPAAIGNYDIERVFDNDTIEDQNEDRQRAGQAYLMFFVIVNTLFVISYFIAMTTTLYRKKGKFKEYYYN